MANLAQINPQESRYKKVLVYGPSGAGKTRAVGALAEKFKLIWLDGESGWETLLQHPESIQKNIELLPIPDTPEQPMFSETVTKIVTGVPCWVDEETGKVNHPLREKNNRPSTLVHMKEAGPDTILVIDSISALEASIRFNMVRKKPEDYKFEWDDWGNLGNVLTKVLTYIQGAQFHVVCIAHEGMVKLSDNVTEKMSPMIGTRNFTRNSGKFFSDVVYMEIVNKAHRAVSSTTYSNKITAKSRTNVAVESQKEIRLLDLFGR